MTGRGELPEAVAFLLGEQQGRCGCAGQCGDAHPYGCCGVDELGCLSVAPADRAIPIEWATTVPADQLLVWCRPCRDSAEAAARKDGRGRVDRELDSPVVESSDDTAAERPQLNWWLQGVLADFYAARDQWDADCATYSKEYPTEAAEFAELHPRPQLRDFLRDHRHSDDATTTENVAVGQPDAAVSGPEAIDRAQRAVETLRQRQLIDGHRDWDAELSPAGRSREEHVETAGRTPVGLGW